MKIDRKALKWAAKQKLRGQKPSPLIVTLFFLLLTAGISTAVRFAAANPIQLIQSVVQALDQGYSSIDVLNAVTTAQNARSDLMYPLNLLIMLFGWVVSFGYASYTLNRTRGLPAGFGDLISVFSRSGRVLVMNLIVFGFSICWYLMVTIPVTIFITIAMTALLMFGAGSSLLDSGNVFMDTAALFIVSFVVVIVVILVVSLVLLFILSRYAVSDYVLLDDPNIGALDAVRRSRSLMRGQAGEYVKLQFSFLGWQLLVALIGGVVFLVVWVLICVFFAASGNAVYTIGLAAAYGLSLLASLPLMLWVTAYIRSTMAEYYCALASGQPVEAAPAAAWPPTPGPNHTAGGPDLF